MKTLAVFAVTWAVTLGAGLSAAELTLHHPDFVSRLGTKVQVEVGDTDPGVSLQAGLSNENGLRRTIAEKAGPLAPEEVVTLDLRDLPADTYTLTVALSDGRRAERTWTKPYDGVPRVGIDENNAVCVDGKPFFPVAPWCLGSEEEIERWSPYINTLHGVGFVKDQWTIDGCRRIMDLAQKHGKMFVGPVRGSYWAKGGTETGTCYYTGPDGRRVKEPTADHAKMGEYVDALKDHPALLLWNWHDEPELDNRENCNPPQEVREWTVLTHRRDGQHPVFVNTGAKYARPLDNWAVAHIKDYTYEFGDFAGSDKVLMADVISQDNYPIESANDPNYPGTIEKMCTGMDRMVDWNRNLAAFMACIETCDINPRDPGGPPTPTELRALCWANIVHGARGLTWFHYFTETPAENFAEMARFLDQVTRLTPAVCGPDYVGDIEKTDEGGGRVDIMCHTADGALYIFAVNVRREPVTARFVLDVKPETVDVVDEDRTIAADGGAFSDEFLPLAVHIYRIPLQR